MTDNAARPLNVTDALDYLDRIKNRFLDRPEVYHQFLGVMREYKAQTCVILITLRMPWLKTSSIDTPGAIQQVSILFHGHSELIGAFSMFLPTGYHIETSSDPRQGAVTVTTPTGVLALMPEDSIRRLSPDPFSLQPEST